MKFKEHPDGKLRRLMGRLQEAVGRIPSMVTHLVRPSAVIRNDTPVHGVSGSEKHFGCPAWLMWVRSLGSKDLRPLILTVQCPFEHLSLLHMASHSMSGSPVRYEGMCMQARV